MNELSLMEKFSDPNLIGSLSFGEKMTGSLLTMLLGMGITFCILMLLWGSIVILTKLVNAGTPKVAPAGMAISSAPSAPVNTAPLGIAAAPSAAPSGADPAKDAELVAVLMAAIAAYEGDQGSASNLIIRKISRVSGQATVWNSAGRVDCIDSRRF